VSRGGHLSLQAGAELCDNVLGTYGGDAVVVIGYDRIDPDDLVFVIKHSHGKGRFVLHRCDALQQTIVPWKDVVVNAIRHVRTDGFDRQRALGGRHLGPDGAPGRLGIHRVDRMAGVATHVASGGLRVGSFDDVSGAQCRVRDVESLVGIAEVLPTGAFEGVATDDGSGVSGVIDAAGGALQVALPVVTGRSEAFFGHGGHRRECAGLDELNTVQYRTPVTPRAPGGERAARADRRSARGADTRNEMLAAAVSLLAEHDVDGFSLRQVAEAAGYAPPTVYLHFADKDDLLFHAAKAGCATFGSRLAEAAAGERDPVDRIEAIGRAYVEFGLAHPVEYRLMFLRRGDMLMRATPDGPPIIDGFDVLIESVEAAMAAGALPEQSSREVAAWLWTTVHGIVALHLSVPGIDADAARAFYERTARVLRDGFYTLT